jgi:uncharacterized protein (TIGR02001 family)
MNKKTLIPSIVLAAAAATPAISHAELSANIGWVSDYVFRGVFQEDSSASAGLDYSNSGFYVGTWGADVGTGLETDLYFGYGAESGDFSWSVGYTGYYYTDDWDGTYTEVNLGVGYGIFALDYAQGKHDILDSVTRDKIGDEDYSFTSVTITSPKGAYIKYGTYGKDFDGSYWEVGYGYSFEDQGIDLSLALINSSDLPLGDPNDLEGGDSKLTFGITKSIGIRD